MPSVRLRMNKKNLALVLCGAALAVAWAGLRARGDDNSDAVVREVRAVLDQQAADWNKGDLDGFLTGYWNSPKVVFMSGGRRFDGYEAMRERYRRRYKAEGRAMGQLAFSELEVESLGPESVFARGRFSLTMPDGAKPTGLFTLIVRKFPDGWKIVHDHTSADETPQASAKAKASPQ
jgi:ketosteroid isomerase-like protein